MVVAISVPQRSIVNHSDESEPLKSADDDEHKRWAQESIAAQDLLETAESLMRQGQSRQACVVLNEIVTRFHHLDQGTSAAEWLDVLCVWEELDPAPIGPSPPLPSDNIPLIRPAAPEL